MPEIEVRPVDESDWPTLSGMDHHYSSEYVWQLTTPTPAVDERWAMNFRIVRLPRPLKVEYPRSVSRLMDYLSQPDGHSGEVLVAALAGQPVGYAALNTEHAGSAAWITDLVVDRPLRRQGIATGLVLACAEWAHSQGYYQVILEAAPKNHPAIRLAEKLGFEFCGFHDHYYGSHGIGLFFRKSL